MKWRVQLANKRFEVGANQSKKMTVYFSASETAEHQVYLSAAQDAQLDCEITVGSLHEKAQAGNLTIRIICLPQGPGATVNCTLKVVTKAGQNHSIKTEQLQVHPNTTSSVKVKAVVFKDGFHQYHATIQLEPNSINAQAWQENKILLAEAGAKAISEPTLQIKHDAVQCGHGTAISQLDANHLWYLQLRGISLKRARQLLFKGFLI
jgi:Fe-S cluster assembly scaffold protein SufB